MTVYRQSLGTQSEPAWRDAGRAFPAAASGETTFTPLPPGFVRGSSLRSLSHMRVMLNRKRTFTNTFVALCSLLLLSWGKAWGQTAADSVAVYANVQDSFTYEMLKGVHVEIMRADSSLIDEFYTGDAYHYGGYPHNVDRIGYLYIPRATCIFRFTKEGYEPRTMDLDRKNIGRNDIRTRN